MEPNVYQILKDWHELLKTGAITENEFTAKKSELLGSGQANDTNQNEDLIIVRTPEQQAQYDAEYDLLFNTPTWFQKNKSWIIGISISVLTGFVVWYLTAKSSNSFDILNNQSIQTNIATTGTSEDLVGEPIENVGNSILFTIFDGISENGLKNSEIIAVPIALYINGQYEDPPRCDNGSNKQKAIDECEKAKEILLPSVGSGSKLYILDNGKRSNDITVLSTKQFGYSNLLSYSALIKQKPQTSILTNNSKLGTNKLYSVKNRPSLPKRINSDGITMTDKLLTKVDIDGDGIPELIYECEGYEVTFYQIYSSKNGGWTKVYEGGYQGY